MSIPAALLALGAAAWSLVQPPPLRPLDGPVDRVLVNKGDRELFLLRDGWPVRMYPIALGFAPEGDKVRQGDGRTPEGVFRIDRRNDQSRFHLSLGLDYPHPDDVARAEAGGYSPGGDIFIHGQHASVPDGHWVSADWTEGCIAIADAHMDVLWEVVPMGTEVEIRP